MIIVDVCGYRYCRRNQMCAMRSSSGKHWLRTKHNVQSRQCDQIEEANISVANCKLYLNKVASYIMTMPESPQSNGVAERMNRTLWNQVRSMLFTATLPEQWWGEAIMTATYIHNRLVHATTNRAYNEWEHC